MGVNVYTVRNNIFVEGGQYPLKRYYELGSGFIKKDTTVVITDINPISGRCRFVLPEEPSQYRPLIGECDIEDYFLAPRSYRNYI